MNAEWRLLFGTARTFAQVEPRWTAIRRLRHHHDRLMARKPDFTHRSRSFATSSFAFAPPSSSGNDDGRHSQPGLAKIVYLLNPIQYIANWYRLLTLRLNWDPQFSTNEFIVGAKQAVIMVSSLLARGDFDALSHGGFLSTKALEFARAEVARLDHSSKPFLRLSMDEIQIAAVQRVNLQTIVELRYADIDVQFVGTKIKDERDDLRADGRKLHVVFVNISTRFHREYTEGVLPSWTITHLSYQFSGL